jgi:hypothetical protein
MDRTHTGPVRLQPRLHGRSGQILVLSTLSLVFLFGVIGMAVDIGFAFMTKRRAQTAADAAAIGAAVYAKVNGDSCGVNVTCGAAYACANPPVSPPTNALQAGCLYAKQNGFLNDGTQQQISLTENNTSLGGGLNPTLWIKATVSQQYSNLFSRVTGFTGGYSGSNATAGVSGNPNAQCAYILGTSSGGGSGMSISGNATVTLSGCGLYSNDGISQTGSTSSIIATSGNIYTYGTNSYSSGHVSPAPTSEASPISDPLAALAKPTVPSTCDHTSFSNSTGGPLTSGVYCGGMTLSSSSLTTLGSGIYYIVGGGLNISGGNVTGSGVMFYLTCNVTYPAHATSISGSGTVSITAPTSGPYIGILIFQDSACPTSANQMSGSASSASTGALYFPNTELDISGSSGSSYLSIIAFSLKASGGGNIGLQRDPTGSVIGLRSSWLIQ